MWSDIDFKKRILTVKRTVQRVAVHNGEHKTKSYAAEYPLFYKHKLLLLILPFYRLGRALIKSRKRIVTEIKTLINL